MHRKCTYVFAVFTLLLVRERCSHANLLHRKVSPPFTLMSSLSLREVHRHIVSSVPLALFIDNVFVQPLRNGRMSVIDPADESVITTQVPAATSEDVDLAVAAAARAFKTWGKTTGACVFVSL
jgi:hypothetical protein